MRFAETLKPLNPQDLAFWNRSSLPAAAAIRPPHPPHACARDGFPTMNIVNASIGGSGLHERDRVVRCVNRAEQSAGWVLQVRRGPTAATLVDNPYCGCKLTRVRSRMQFGTELPPSASLAHPTCPGPPPVRRSTETRDPLCSLDLFCWCVG